MAENHQNYRESQTPQHYDDSGESRNHHQPMDILACFHKEPKTLDYCLPNMLVGTVGSLVSPGGAGKSMFALQLACQIAGGPDLLEIGNYPTGKVIFLPAEDPPAALHHRLFALGARLGEDERRVIADHLIIQPLLGLGPDILDHRWFAGLLRAADGKRLMILDTLRRFHTEEENSSGPMAKVVGQMEKIADKTGCSILFLHHTGKAAALSGDGDQQQASRGSSVLVDNIRWVSYLNGLGKNEAEEYEVNQEDRGYYVRFGVSKTNYGAPFIEQWYQRHEGGVLFPIDLERVIRNRRRGGRDEL
jgi:RecA-family ATPase